MSARLVKEPMSDYLRAPGISASLIATLDRQTPLHAHARQETSPALEEGELIHAACLEPEQFDRLYAVCSHEIVDAKGNPASKPRATKAWRDWADSVRAKGKVPLYWDQYEKVENLRLAFQQNPHAQRILSGAEVEVSVYFNENGIDYKTRFDVLNEDREIGADLKSTQDANPRRFARDASRYGYVYKCALYLRAMRALGMVDPVFCLIALEKTPPHATSVHVYNSNDLKTAQARIDQLSQTWLECVRTQTFPGYQAVNELCVPCWDF